MAQNRGKDFENIVRESLNRLEDITVIRLYDQTMGYLGGRNICDLIAYKYPTLYLIECKAVHGNRLSFSNISENQWRGLDAECINPGVKAGIVCWWIDHDVTRFIPIDVLWWKRDWGDKSICYDDGNIHIIDIPGIKKRVFFEYDFSVLWRQ